MSHPLGMRHCNVGMLYLPLGCASRVGLLERVTSSAAAAGFLGLRTFNRQSHRQIPRIFTHDIPAIRIQSASPNPQRLSGLDIFRGRLSMTSPIVWCLECTVYRSFRMHTLTMIFFYRFGQHKSVQCVFQGEFLSAERQRLDRTVLGTAFWIRTCFLHSCSQGTELYIQKNRNQIYVCIWLKKSWVLSINTSIYIYAVLFI